MRTITVNGYTGSETDAELSGFYHAKLAEIRGTTASRDEAVKMFSKWIDHHHASLGAAKYHNRIAGPAERFTGLRRTATARIREADDAYAELEKRTTTAWHAAHHRMVLASTAARNALADLIETANEVHTASAAGLRYITREVYEELVPAEDRVIDLPDLDALRAELDEFVETIRERFAITAVTLAGTCPAGFEPAQPPAPAEEERQYRREDYEPSWR